MKKFFQISSLNHSWCNLRLFLMFCHLSPMQRLMLWNLLSGSSRVAESNEVSPQPPFLQTKQPQSPQPLLITSSFTNFTALFCTQLSNSTSFLQWGAQKWTQLFEVQSHQCCKQGVNHFPSSASHTVSDTGQVALVLGHLGTLLMWVQPAVDQYTHVLFSWATFHPLFPKPMPLHEVIMTHVQDPALSPVDIFRLVLL